MINWLLRIPACKVRRPSWLKVECVCWGIYWAQLPIELEDVYKASFRVAHVGMVDNSVVFNKKFLFRISSMAVEC